MLKNKPYLWLSLLIVVAILGVMKMPGVNAIAPLPPDVVARPSIPVLVPATAAPAPEAPPPSRWCIFGDSLTVGARDALMEQFGPDTAIEAKSGRNIAQAWPSIEARPTGCQPVVTLGTNNLAYDQADSLKLIRETLDRFDRPVLWVNTFARKYTGQQDRFNEALTIVATEQPEKLKILDWASFIAQHRDWQEQDGIHLTAEGYQQRAIWFKQQVAQ